MATDKDHLKPPSQWLLAIEGRTIFEFGAFFLAYPLLRTAPRGDGHPVLVLPGLGASDRSTQAMRWYLKDMGYAPHGWQLGRNYGRHNGVGGEMLDGLRELHTRYQRKVSIIGWSLGGIFARELAKMAPEVVRGVITLGSPISCCPRSTNAWRMYEFLSGKPAEVAGDDLSCRHGVDGRKDTIDAACAVCASERRVPPPVPTTAIYSRTDGIVPWQCALEVEAANTENIEVESSHCGLGHNPAALYAIADRLAQPEGARAPFDRTGLKNFYYPDPKRSSGWTRWVSQ